eukprot:gene10805-biopygen7633
MRPRSRWSAFCFRPPPCTPAAVAPPAGAGAGSPSCQVTSAVAPFEHRLAEIQDPYARVKVWKVPHLSPLHNYTRARTRTHTCAPPPTPAGKSLQGHTGRVRVPRVPGSPTGEHQHHLAVTDSPAYKLQCPGFPTGSACPGLAFALGLGPTAAAPVALHKPYVRQPRIRE